MHDSIEPVAEFRAECALYRFVQSRYAYGLIAKADERFADVPRTCVACHNEYDIAEVRLAALVVGKRCIIHDLEKNIVDVGMGFFDFIKKHDCIRCLADCIGQQAAFFIADISGRRPDQTAHSMLFLIFAHVEAMQGNRKMLGELARKLCFSDTRRADKKEIRDWLVWRAESCSGTFDCSDNGFYSLILAEHFKLERRFEGRELVFFGRSDGALGDSSDFCDHNFDVMRG